MNGCFWFAAGYWAAMLIVDISMRNMAFASVDMIVMCCSIWLAISPPKDEKQ